MKHMQAESPPRLMRGRRHVKLIRIHFFTRVINEKSLKIIDWSFFKESGRTILKVMGGDEMSRSSSKVNLCIL